MTAVIEHDQVFMIAQDFFAAMVDGDHGLLLPWHGDLPAFTEPIVGWVDLFGEWSGRAALTTERSTAHDLARALLDLAPDERITDLDLVDAFGEVANVVGGNVKSLLPTQGSLGLPQVGRTAPEHPGAVVEQELRLSWRGLPLVVTIWAIAAGEEGNRS
jgi:chemotaxis protein CheX